MNFDKLPSHLRSCPSDDLYEDDDWEDEDDDDWDEDDEDEDWEDDREDEDDDEDYEEDWDDDDEDYDEDWDDEDEDSHEIVQGVWPQEAVEELALYCQVSVFIAHRAIVICHLRLPPGYDRNEIPLLVELPADYPCSPPGIAGRRVYVPPDLRFHGHRLADIHPGTTPCFSTPGFGPWAWLCYETIEWNPLGDNLITFLEMIRGDLTDPTINQ